MSTMRLPLLTLLLTTLLHLTTAQTPTTLTLPLLGSNDTSTLSASIIHASPLATTLSLACPTLTPDCGLFPYQTLTYGPQTYKMDMSGPGSTNSFTGTQDCSIASSTAGAVCKESAGGPGANFPGSSTTTYEPSEVGNMLVVVTAGAEKLGAESGGATTTQTQMNTESKAGGKTAAATPGASVMGSGAPAASVTRSGSGSAAAPAHTGGAASGKAKMLGGGIVGLVVMGVMGGFVLDV